MDIHWWVHKLSVRDSCELEESVQLMQECLVQVL